MSAAPTMAPTVRYARMMIGGIVFLGVLVAIYVRWTISPSPVWTHFTVPALMFAIGLDRLLFPLPTDSKRARRIVPAIFFSLAALGVLFELI